MQIDKSYRQNLHRIVENHVPEDVIASNNRKGLWKYGYNTEYDIVVISKNGTIGQILNINGLLIALPQTPKEIRKTGLRNTEQKWTRYPVPKELEHFDKYYKDDSQNIESILRNVYNKYNDFITKDIDRIKNGDWFMNDGEPIYITGFYYFFLQHYKLTNMRRYGDFRMVQRDYFIWLEACMADDRCLGSLLLKSRRSYFSTSSGSIVLCKSIFTRNGFFPIVSKKDTDAKTLFEDHIIKPLNQLPKHLQPQRVGEVSPKKELLFSSPKKKLTTNNKTSSTADGLDTLITFYATTIDAYDGTQVTFSINDEIGKMKGNLNINEYWDQAHKMCHLVGGEVVGKAICGSTANPPHLGGRNYEEFYNNSKLKTRNDSGRTITGLYSIFIPADYTLYGFCDEWGYSVIESPNIPITNEIGKTITYGAKYYLDQQEVNCGNDLKKLNAQKRNNPRVDTDAFLDEDATSMYGTTGLVKHLNFLNEYQYNPKYKEQVFRFDLVWKDGKRYTTIEMVRNENGRYMASWLPPEETRNQFKMVGTRKVPINTDLGAFGADPYRADKAKFGNGSKQGFIGLTKENYHSLTERERNKMFLYYNHRPDTVEDAHDDIIKAIVYFSIPVLPEINVDSLVKTLYEKGYRGYVLNNPLKIKRELTPTEEKYGGIISNEKSIESQETVLETFVKMNIPETVDENNITVPYIEMLADAQLYKRENRSQRDRTVAWQLAVLANSDKIKKKEPLTTETITDFDIIKMFEAPVIND